MSEQDVPLADEVEEPLALGRVYFTWILMLLSVPLTAAGAWIQFDPGYGLMVAGALMSVWAFIIGRDD